MDGGTVTLSLEIELGWGVHDHERENRFWQLDSSRELETEALAWLLECAQTHDIPITFDVVGHLLLEECDGDHDGPHAPGWFDADPGTDVDRDPLFYAPDLVDMIEDSPLDHEICTHTFSHVECDAVSRETLDWELERSRELHEAAGYGAPTAIVAPRHRPAPTAALTDHGITHDRMPAEGQDGSDARLRSAWILNRDHPVYDPEREDGVLTSYSTPYPSLSAPYLSRGAAPPPKKFGSIPLGWRQRNHRKYLAGGIDRAIESNGYTHFWAHLFDINQEVQRPPIEAMFEKLAAERADGDVVVTPLGELAPPDQRREIVA
jgi:hypothetical protein